jgi:non-specific serine/threonine protein kinase
MLGDAVGGQREHSHAAALVEESLALYHTVGDRGGILSALHSLARLARTRGDLQRAQTLYEENLAASPSHLSVVGTVYFLEGLAGVASAQGRMERAARLWGAAAALREARQIAPPALDATQQEHDMAAAQRALGIEAFTAAWTSGWGQSTERSIADVLLEAR